jgi:hypothetical protein
MRPLLISTVLLALAGDVSAEPLRIRFRDAHESAGGDAWIDLGSVAARPCGFRAAGRCVRSTVTRKRIGISVEGEGTGFARLSANLVTDDPRARVRVDGVLLSSSPQLVDAGAPIGRAVAHTVEIEVPASEPAGPVAAAITWRAEVDR